MSAAGAAARGKAMAERDGKRRKVVKWGASGERIPLGIPEGEVPVDRLFVRDLALSARVGVNDGEADHRQRLIVSIDAFVNRPTDPFADDINLVVSYDRFIDAARAVAAGPHINLVETVAERIAAACLDEPGVRRVIVRVEKPDVVEDAGSVGAEIERYAD